MARLLSLEEQIAAMKSTWPGLVPRNIDRRIQSVRWVGKVRALYCWYMIEIRYQVGSMPEIRVLAPPLLRLPGNKEGELPHVYPPADDPTLCLFDPRNDEWDASMSFAETIVLWVFDWLSCYELWLMTGKWTGGGRHVGDPLTISKEDPR